MKPNNIVQINHRRALDVAVFGKNTLTANGLAALSPCAQSRIATISQQVLSCGVYEEADFHVSRLCG